jgi:hypothetical protein
VNLTPSARDLRDGFKARFFARRKRLAETFAAQAGVFGHLRHAE